MSAFPVRTAIREKRLMTQAEAHKVIIHLKSSIKFGSCLRFISTRRLNEKLAETEELRELLTELTDHHKVGDVAEWILRQYLNRAGSLYANVQPPSRFGLPKIVKEVPCKKTRYNFAKKSESLRDEFLRSLIAKKIERDPVGYEIEKNHPLSEKTREQPSRPDVSSNFGQSKMGTKRKFVLVLKKK